VDAEKDDPEHQLAALDPTAERFRGTIPSANVFRLLDDARVLNILFAPAGYTYPDSPDKPVPIRIMLREGLAPSAQRLLYDQTLAHLERLGFQNALAYDTRRYTQLKGTIPYRVLDRLVKDLRTEPAGWLLPETPPDRLPSPLSDRNPLRWVEVMPAVELPSVFVPELVLPAREVFTPELRALLADPGRKETPVRVVALFAYPIEDRADDIRTRLAADYGRSTRRSPDGNPVKTPDGQPALTDGASLEGVLGNLASIRFDRPADVERFVAEPGVIGVRLPRAANETITPLPAGGNAAAAGEWLRSSGVEALHRLGYRGAGIKVLVVGSDFTGADKLIGAGLPKNTRLIDLTTGLNQEIVPLPTEADRAGYGLGSALAVALAAPDAELVLVRVNPGAIFQLAEILRIARGDSEMTQALRSRLADITLKTAELSRRKEAAIAEYRSAFADLSDDEATRARRLRARAALDAVDAEQVALVKRTARFHAFRKELTAALTGGRVIVNTLEWESGFALDSLSALSRRLEALSIPISQRVIRRAGDPAAQERPPIVWVQAASDAGATVWGGAFLDANKNGIMEFAPADRPLPSENWSPELNFLAAQAPTGATTPDLTPGTRLRFTMQWREPIDPHLPAVSGPAYPVVLRVFRQLDPSGSKQPSDEMTEAARSAGGPYPILVAETFVVYEQILEFDVATAGRYALVIATGEQPPPLLPALKRDVETYPRVVVETISAKRGEGRVVFRSYATKDAGVGIPGDSLGAITVGTGSADELVGGGTGLTLRPKPDLFGPPALDVAGRALRGPGVATGFVGGVAATLAQAGAAGANVFRSAGVEPGRAVAVPEEWLKQLKPAKP
jgi:hypothetical protein